MAASKPNKRGQQRIETRQKIYDTAMDLFSRKGYTKVSVSDICGKAGVSKGTFYYYFDSKDQIFLEEYLKIDDFFITKIEELESKYKSPTKRLVAFTIAGFAYMDKLGLKITKVIWHGEIDPATRRKGMANPRRPIYAILEQMMREGQEKGELRRDVSAATLTQLFVRCYRGVIYEWCLQNGKFDLVEACGEFTKMIIEGFKKQ